MIFIFCKLYLYLLVLKLLFLNTHHTGEYPEICFFGGGGIVRGHFIYRLPSKKVQISWLWTEGIDTYMYTVYSITLSWSKPLLRDGRYHATSFLWLKYFVIWFEKKKSTVWKANDLDNSNSPKVNKNKSLKYKFWFNLKFFNPSLCSELNNVNLNLK